jgi:hypothetical protein
MKTLNMLYKEIVPSKETWSEYVRKFTTQVLE